MELFEIFGMAAVGRILIVDTTTGVEFGPLYVALTDEAGGACAGVLATDAVGEMVAKTPGP